MRTSLAALVTLSASLFAYAAEQSPAASVTVKNDADRKLPRRALAESLGKADDDAPISNAERLARGLAPSRPRKLFSPTEELAPRASPSSNPPTDPPTPPTYPLCGWITAMQGNTQLGYLLIALNEDGVLGKYDMLNVNAVMQVCVDAPDSQSGYSNIVVTNAPIPSIPFLGAIEGPSSSTEDLDGTQGDYAVIGFVAPTDAGSGPSTDFDGEQNSYDDATNSRQQYESNVWSVDVDTGIMSVHWTQTDRSTEFLMPGMVYNSPASKLNPSLVAAPNPLNFMTMRNTDFNPTVLMFTTVKPNEPA